MLAKVCAIDPDKVRLDAPLIAYGLDSARAIDLIIAIEDEFGIGISDDAAARMKTTGDIVAHVRTQLGK